ncbi:protein kinase [Streptomyces sp. SID4956]|nr:protein kinase [Streptomyces sp. SID4956]
MQRIGISHSTAHLRFGDDWKLQPRALDAGPGWEDRLAVRDDGLVQESGRVRIYLAGQAASAEQRAKVDRVARREYQVLQGINHRGIVQAAQIREHQGGPAILFRHRESDLRLEAYLDAYGGRLTPAVRLDLVRQLAEAVRYAHHRSLYHRALAARSVYVSAREDGSEPVRRIADWQTAARDAGSGALPRSAHLTGRGGGPAGERHTARGPAVPGAGAVPRAGRAGRDDVRRAVRGAGRGGFSAGLGHRATALLPEGRGRPQQSAGPVVLGTDQHQLPVRGGPGPYRRGP